jgi:hypothetical protein
MISFVPAAVRSISVALATAALFLSGCGGGSTTVAGGITGTGGTVSGTGTAGPLGGAVVTAFAVSGGAVGAAIATGSSDAQGNFSLALGQYAGPLVLQMSGGSYIDEATGQTMTMNAGDVLTAALPSIAAGATVTGIQVTPVTSMAFSVAQNKTAGLSDANINASNLAVGHYFMVADILHEAPMNPLASGSANGATQDAVNYGMVLAAMSQYAYGLSLPSSSAIITAMANDASDGTMDGMKAGSPVTIGGPGMGM